MECAAEEAEGDRHDAEQDQRQRRGGGQQHADQHQREGRPQHLAPAQPPGQMAHPGGAEGADQVDAEDQPDRGLAEVVRRRQQAIAEVVVDGDERAQQQEALGEQPRQAGIAEQPGKAAEQAAQMRTAAPRNGATAAGCARTAAPASRPTTRHRAHADAPAEEIGEHAGDQPAAHAADGVAADVQAHAQADRIGVHLFGEVGHRHHRHAAQGEAQQHAQRQQHAASCAPGC